MWEPPLGASASTRRTEVSLSHEATTGPDVPRKGPRRDLSLAIRGCAFGYRSLKVPPGAAHEIRPPPHQRQLSPCVLLRHWISQILELRITHCLQCSCPSPNPAHYLWTLALTPSRIRPPDRTLRNTGISHASPGQKSSSLDRPTLTGTCWLFIPEYDPLRPESYGCRARQLRPAMIRFPSSLSDEGLQWGVGNELEGRIPRGIISLWETRAS